MASLPSTGTGLGQTYKGSIPHFSTYQHLIDMRWKELVKKNRQIDFSSSPYVVLTYFINEHKMIIAMPQIIRTESTTLSTLFPLE